MLIKAESDLPWDTYWDAHARSAEAVREARELGLSAQEFWEMVKSTRDEAQKTLEEGGEE